MNKLSITTSVFATPNPESYQDTLQNTLSLCRQAGFAHVDFNLAEAAREDYPIARDNWEAFVDLVGETLAKNGLQLAQAHSLVFRSIVSMNPNFPEREWFEEKIRRTILAAGRLGAPWLVFHPADDALSPYYDFERNRSYNLGYWPPFLELAKKAGVGVAFENLYPSGRKLNRYCANYLELIDLVDSFSDPLVGICWDTGHALCAQQHQQAALKAIGPRLKVTHIHDNHGRVKDDEHMIPYLGSNDWDGILAALKDIRYQGPFSLETRTESTSLPQGLKLHQLRFARLTGQHMIQQIQDGAAS